MTNLEKYDRIFEECFEITLADLDFELKYKTIPAWNSIGHMTLMEALEDAFGIMLDTEDVLTFGSYENGKAVLGKYGIAF